MKRHERNRVGLAVVITALFLTFNGTSAQAKIDGLIGNTFSFTAKVDYVSTADGGSMLLWGLADSTGGRAQYPAPTLIVNQGQQITVNLTNNISVAKGAMPNTSLVFPGHDVAESCTTQPCTEGLITLEAGPDGMVSYTFTAGSPGTYTYYSGTDQNLQIDMGLTGAIIVRPTGFNADSPTAYGHQDTAYDYEDLFFLTEMDPNLHRFVEFNGADTSVMTDVQKEEFESMLDNYFSNYWFINGRTAPDDLAAAGIDWLPTQPYNSTPRMHPGDRLLMRVVGGGREMHPFHHHGNHATVIARDGRMPESTPGAGPDLALEGFTITSTPGQTVDAIFTWTGEKMGWDIYGGEDVWDTNPGLVHDCVDNDTNGYDDSTFEFCEDHGKPFPVILPGNLELAFGGWWGGSPYLGSLGSLPPGEGGLNPNGGYSFMWHSHTEKELTNWDIFPGGMLTMMIIEPHGVNIEK